MSANVQAGLFHERERWSLAAQRDEVRHRLAEEIHYVARASAFYARKWGEGLRSQASRIASRDIYEFLEELPLTGKDELRQSQERNPPFGDYLACDKDDVARVHRTTGTTGRPLIIALSQDDAQWTASHGAQAFWCAGLRPSDIVVHCLNYSMWAGGVTDHMALERMGAAVVPFGVGNTDTLISLPRWIPFTAVSCTPSYVSLLLEKVTDDEDRRRWLESVRLFLVGGEPGGSNPALRETVATAFGASVKNANYGLAEVLSIFGSECPATRLLHFHGQGSVSVELINPETYRPVQVDDGNVGELVLTHARRRAQPLVRYRTNDLVEIASVETCECGRGGFRFRVLGRADDMFVVRGINVFPGAIAEVLSEVSPDLREFQVALPEGDTHDYVPLRVEASSRMEPPELAARIASAIKMRLGCSARVEVVPQGELPRFEGKSRRVIREREERSN